MGVRDRDTKAGEVKLSSAEALEDTDSPPLTALKRDNLLVQSETAADAAACSPVVAQPLRSPGPQVPPVHPLQAAPLRPPCAPPAVLRVGHWGLGGSCRAPGSIPSCARGDSPAEPVFGACSHAGSKFCSYNPFPDPAGVPPSPWLGD